MGVTVVDGVLESAEVKSKRKRWWRMRDVRIAQRDGRIVALPSVVVTPEVGAALTPGLRGRFLTYSTLDQSGIHAVKPDGGRPVSGYPLRAVETIGLVITAIFVVATVVRLATGDDVPLLPFLVGLFTAALFFNYRSTRLAVEAKARAESFAA